MDTVSKEKRSQIMSKVKGSDTKVEKFVRSELFKQGFRFKKNVSDLPGKPDIVLPAYNCVVFVHGCFWHGHKSCLRLPKTNREYWVDKIEKNKIRDQRSARKLRARGWRVFTIWECKLKKNNKKEIEKLIRKIRR